MLIYTSEPSSAAEDALNLLASWAATAGDLHPGDVRGEEREVPSPKTDRVD